MERTWSRTFVFPIPAGPLNTIWRLLFSSLLIKLICSRYKNSSTCRPYRYVKNKFCMCTSITTTYDTLWSSTSAVLHFHPSRACEKFEQIQTKVYFNWKLKAYYVSIQRNRDRYYHTRDAFDNLIRVSVKS